MKCIDAHVHIYEHFHGYGFMGEFRIFPDGTMRMAGGESGRVIPEGFGTTGVSAERALAFMDEMEIERAVLLQGSAYGFQNEYISESVQRYPDRFTGAATIDPCIRLFDRVFDRLTKELNFNIFKMEISEFGGFMGYHNPNTFLDEPNLQKICAHLNRTNGTLALDIGQPGTVSHRVEKYLAWVERYPDMKFVFCHLLSMTPKNVETLRREMELLNQPNVWYDLASIACNTSEHAPYRWAREYLKIAGDIAGAERLLWGSDMPTTLSDYPYLEAQEIITKAGIFSDSELKRIFRENAKDAYSIK
ncbi:MAG: amidohydrolase [Eubacteriales bacterium]|nr:amidohydrolase [Eubacteriales bacterium]